MVIEAFYQSDEETWLYDFEHFEHFLHFDYIETNFDNWKDSLGDLTFETLITILTIENLNSVNYSYQTINCDTGQHSQFLRCSYSHFTAKNFLCSITDCRDHLIFRIQIN